MKYTIPIIIITFLLISGCKNKINSEAISPSVLDCQERNGEYQIITNPDGSQTGRCILPNGTICTDEQYFQEGCYPDQID